MGLKIHEAVTRDEFDAIIDVVWTALQEPFHPSFHWLHPIHGYTDEDRVACMKAEADRFWQSNQKNPASHWFYAANADGEVVGVAEWQVYTANPFPNGPIRLECTWFPEGETRDFVTEYINQIFYARMNWMNRPYIAMNAMAVIPKIRGRGVGSLLMDWGIRKAEELNLECFTEASGLGRDLYARFGFKPLMSVAINMHKKDASQLWRRLQSVSVPMIATLMWRPAPRDLESGDSSSFWQLMASNAKLEPSKEAS